MADEKPLTFTSAVLLFAEIRDNAGWTCRHGMDGHRIGIWCWRTESPMVKPFLVLSRSEWLWRLETFLNRDDVPNWPDAKLWNG